MFAYFFGLKSDEASNSEVYTIYILILHSENRIKNIFKIQKLMHWPAVTLMFLKYPFHTVNKPHIQ